MSNHAWCSNPARDEAVRATEDGRHGPLPTLLECIETARAMMPKSVSSTSAPEPENKVAGMRTERVTLEITQRADRYHPLAAWDWPGTFDGLDRLRGESVRVVEDDLPAVHDMDGDRVVMSWPELAKHLTAERDAAIRERDAANEECGRLRAKIVVMEGSAQRDMEAEIAVEEAWERCEIAPHWPSDETGSSHRYAASMEGEIVRLRARVAELENAANAGGVSNPEPISGAGKSGETGKQEPVAWGVKIEGRGLYGHYDFEAEARGVCDAVNAEEGWSMTVVPLYAAPQPPRGWLTSDERESVEILLDAIAPSGGNIYRDEIATLGALLARSTPLRVMVPKYFPMSWAHERDDAWIAAIREAGGEVE